MNKKLYDLLSVKNKFESSQFPYKELPFLLKELDIEIMKMDMQSKYPTLVRDLEDKNLRGALYFSKNQLRYFILIHVKGMSDIECDYNLSLNEKERFTVMHELGHYFKLDLHKISKKTMEEGIVFYRDAIASSGSDDEEKFANNFAAECLIPEKHVLNYLQSISLEIVQLPQDESSVTTMARRFGVNDVVVKFRLKNLGLLKGDV